MYLVTAVTVLSLRCGVESVIFLWGFFFAVCGRSTSKEHNNNVARSFFHSKGGWNSPKVPTSRQMAARRRCKLAEHCPNSYAMYV